MRLQDGRLRLSAGDLANHLGCRHLTALHREVAENRRSLPKWKDTSLESLRQRGFEHEAAYVSKLRQDGLQVLIIDEHSADGVAHTKEAIDRGIDVIVQAHLGSADWFGRADILRKVAKPGPHAAWSYEVHDTKLARETRGATLLQLCLYSDLLHEIQGVAPEYAHVVVPGTNLIPETYRVVEYAAYYRAVRRQLEQTLALPTHVDGGAATYPDPVPHCDICHWVIECNRKRRADDHLSLVAGVRKSHTLELQSWSVNTLAALAAMPLPLSQKPKRGAKETYEKLRDQARVQFQERTTEKPTYELLPREAGLGFFRLPAPSPGDIFFDIEGDPFAGTGGLEYLLGYATADGTYSELWSFDAAQEKASFETLMDRVMERWADYPDMHIYHFAPYEPSALKRLMGRHGTREDQLDRMLRAGLFVDLHAVVRQSLRASVERYSLKDLEKFYGLKREVELRLAGDQRAALERMIETGHPKGIPSEMRDAVRGYNRDDCLSTLELRNWLEKIREEVASRESIPRPTLSDGAPPSTLDEHQAKIAALAARLTGDIPAERATRTQEQQACWLLAQLLEFHRREKKSVWWERFRLEELSDEDLRDERAALFGLSYVGLVSAQGKSGRKVLPTHRYTFPPQECDPFREDSEMRHRDKKIGTLVDYDLKARTIDIKKTNESVDVHPPAVFAHFDVRDDVLSDAILALAEWVAEHGGEHAIDADGPYRAARDLLLGRPPRLMGAPAPLCPDGEDPCEAACRIGLLLDSGVLPIQGPPGAGKSHTGADMILALIASGKKVGIVGPSHKVIRNLVEKVLKQAPVKNVRSVRIVQKVKEHTDAVENPVVEVTQNKDIVRALESGVQVAAGTAWLWAHADLKDKVDVLFIDEAGQMSLANTLAVAQAAKSIVLLGDPQQLDQPLKGSHPEGTDASALGHLLGGDKTIASDRGLFLKETWRLSPKICAFTSELFYDGRLDSKADCSNLRVVSKAPYTGTGLFYVPVEHDGNSNRSYEEVHAVKQIVDDLFSANTTWIDHKGAEYRIDTKDILVVAPYNAQVHALTEALPAGLPIGTVDKFQGQEAPIVIVSMATSSADEAPRGMEFLYSLNRLNVATSRAKCVCILVASPRLLEPECRTPRQIQLANALCRYVEMATTHLAPPGAVTD